MTVPIVSVVLSVYNGERHLEEALESVFSQTFTNFELLVIDDGSTDHSGDILKACTDVRLRVYENKKNIGLTASLNKGIAHARGRYIARMDADDVCMPDRFQKQVAFLENHREIGVCGSYAESIGEQRGLITSPHEHDEIVCHLLFGNILVHASIMMRRELLQNDPFVYNPACHYGEDYELWCRLVGCTRFGVIPEPLIQYRLHADQKTADYAREAADGVRSEVLRTFSMVFTRLGIEPSCEEEALHFSISSVQGQRSHDIDHEKLQQWLARLDAANTVKNVFPQAAFQRILAQKWMTFIAPTIGNGDTKQAERAAYWLRHIVQHPKCTGDEIYACASVFKRVGKSSAAEELFKRLISQGEEQRFPGALFHLGELALTKEERSQALVLFKRCVGLFPQHVKAKQYCDLLERHDEMHAENV